MASYRQRLRDRQHLIIEAMDRVRNGRSKTWLAIELETNISHVARVYSGERLPSAVFLSRLVTRFPETRDAVLSFLDLNMPIDQ